MDSKFIIVLIALVTLSTVCCGDDTSTQSRATKVTSKALDSVKQAANKGAQKVEKAADGITVKVERFINPQPHEPGSSNMLIGAARGIGRLMRNVTVEIARAAGTVGTGAVNLVKHTAGAAKQTVRQAAGRISKPRVKPAEPKVESNRSGGSDGEEADTESDTANEADGAAPDELKKSDD